MAKDLGRLYVAVRCDECGAHDEGVPLDGENTNRCGKCGRFAEGADEYCVEHDLDYKGLYPEDNHCPYCREERARRAQRQHEMTRDPTVEPW